MGKTVLTIDDSKTLRIIIGKHLAAFGVQTLEAENGQQGLVRAREGIPDVILLDYNMPIMDGYHTLAELKTDPALKAIPVVMLTTETVKDIVIKLMKLGLKDYIAKPFTREVLLQKLNPILSLYDGDRVPPVQAASPAAAKPQSGAVAPKGDAAPSLKYLSEAEHMWILRCPAGNNPSFVVAMDSDIPAEMDLVAKGDSKKLIIKIADGFLSDLSVVRRFIDVIEHATQLAMKIRLVSDSPSTRDALKQYEELASIPTDTSLVCALRLMQ